MEKEKNPINERIAQFRNARHMNQNDLADELQMKRTTYSQMEREGNISAEKLLAIANILRVHPMDLLVGENERALYDTLYPTDEKKKLFETPDGIRNTGMKQSTFEPAPTIYSSWEESNFEMISKLSKDEKTEIFTLAKNMFDKKK